ncbi:MAG: cytochrome c biogenesis protein CcdA [Patescibacteria group bacterium]
MLHLGLIIPAFIAGLLTFFAPCTLPLVPAYLGFISGASAKELQDQTKRSDIRKRVLLNGLFYVIGFSVVFVLLGILFGLGGAALEKYNRILSRIGGVFIIFFALYLMHVFDAIPATKFLASEKRLSAFHKLKPGSPLSSFLFGATFAFGWTPCIGPILASILFLASSTATVVQGAFLLAIFSLGLAIPFLLIAFAIGHAGRIVHNLSAILPYVSFIGGVFLLALGILLLTGNLHFWLMWIYHTIPFVESQRFLNYL